MILGGYSDYVDDDAGSWISEEASACLQEDGVILLEDLFFCHCESFTLLEKLNDHWTSLAHFP